MKEIAVAIGAQSHETRILVVGELGDMMLARLGPVSQSQPDAVRLLLEALALWHRSPLRVVLSAECEPQLESTGLTDGFGFGVHALHYTVHVVDRDLRRNNVHRLRGLGDFGHLRRDLRDVGPF